MLGEYKYNRSTHQCFVLNRPLKEGEWYYSVILECGEDYKRRDYSVEGWTEPPEGAIGYWKKQMPIAGSKKLVLAPAEVLIDLLRQMEQFPDKAKIRYLLALMLMRKRLIRPASPMRAGTKSQKDESQLEVTDQPSVDPPSGNQASEQATRVETMIIEVIADGSQIEIPVATISKSESETLRDELNELLYCEAAEEQDAEEQDAEEQDAEEQDAQEQDAEQLHADQ